MIIYGGKEKEGPIGHTNLDNSMYFTSIYNKRHKNIRIPSINLYLILAYC